MFLFISLVVCAIALLFEALIGYPEALYRAIGHPVGWIGLTLHRLDHALNRDEDPPSRRQRNGTIAIVGLVVLCAGIGVALQVAIVAIAHLAIALFLLALLASSLLAQRSLDTHVRAVADALGAYGVDAGRDAVALIVGRDTSSLDEAGVARAAIESLAENFSDGIVAPSLWLAILGLPGGIAYKTINTADSMIGHRTPRHEAFGRTAARLDDIVNWPAARLSGLWIVAAAAVLPGASAPAALRTMLRDARGHASPNAGWPEAAMAGALGIELGGPRSYDGRAIEAHTIGDGMAVCDAAMILRALRVYQVACGFNIALIFAAAMVIAQVL